MKDCIICFENIDDNVFTKLDCNHAYHKSCIEQWIQCKNKHGVENIEYTCPYCRKRFVHNTNKCKYIISKISLLLQISQDVYTNIIIYYTIIMIFLFAKIF